MAQTKVANMERRYRYPYLTGAKKKTNLAFGVVKFFVGWNVLLFLGICYMNEKSRRKDPEAYDKKDTFEKFRMWQGQSIPKTGYIVTRAGITKETQVDDTKLTYKLTMKGFKQVENLETKVESEPGLPNLASDKVEKVPEKIIPVETPVPKTANATAGFTGSFYQSVSSISSNIFKWGGDKNDNEKDRGS